MAKKTAHVLAHSHWDREWYQSFEQHRHDFVVLMNRLFEQFEQDSHYGSFHLDGQTILLKDFLDIHPEKEEQLKKWIKKGKLKIGPWYVLQDAFLTSSEANVRNLLYGLADAKVYGNPVMVGYFPDTFGIYGQAPQLLNQAGIKSAAFGRGVKPTGFNNQVADSANFESPYSEMKWISPDGSEVLGILFANWYSNGNEIPVDKEQARLFWKEKLTSAERYASTNHLLFMNGCDHQPLQVDLTDALRVANSLYSEVDFIQSDLEGYLQHVKKELPEEIQEIHGELRNQRTDGWSTLVNTASSRIYLKQLNQRAQSLLEKQVEPLLAFKWVSGIAADGAYTRYAWKQLMENHPHDSICGCSVDEVHEEMVTRLKKTVQVGEKLSATYAAEIGALIDTQAHGESVIPVLVFNGTGAAITRLVSTEVEYDKCYFREQAFETIFENLQGKTTPIYEVIDKDGEILEATFAFHEPRFRYDLPKDQFRQPYFARVLTVDVLVTLPAFGYTTVYLREKERGAEAGHLLASNDQKSLENEFLRVEIHQDGSYDLLCKDSGERYENQGVYENVGDIGNEYMFKAANGGTITTKRLEAEIELLNNSSLKATFAIKHRWEIPVSADATFVNEKKVLKWHPERNAGRSEKKVCCEMVTTITLEKGNPALKLHLEVNNQAKDHRIRVLYPTKIDASTHLADSVFEVAERPNFPEQGWENPSFDHHMQAFASIHDSKRGMTIAGRGLHEYEVLPGENILGITLLRSVSELGDWGYFPTEGAQCSGRQSAEWSVFVHKGDIRKSAFIHAVYQAYVQPVVEQIGVHPGRLAAEYEAMPIQNDNAVVSVIKLTEKEDAVALRIFQPGLGAGTVKKTNHWNVTKSTILEEELEEIVEETIEPYKIHTYIAKRGDNL